ncbi:hypothetical protein QUA13_04885 [Microcoleus sp. S28C3]|uniref:hypothetical protein n=1 Tax=Microcoleus sp. S28C3 TaxID=3055414 RepID=UPI002FD45364
MSDNYNYVCCDEFIAQTPELPIAHNFTNFTRSDRPNRLYTARQTVNQHFFCKCCTKRELENQKNSDGEERSHVFRTLKKLSAIHPVQPSRVPSNSGGVFNT